jgi:hypothetical protein
MGGPGSSELFNTCAGWRGRSIQAVTDPFDEEQHSSTRPAFDPETLLLQTDDVTLIERALSNVPDRFRELLVLRELEGLSYRELSDVLDIPTGTVMSGLSRARNTGAQAIDVRATFDGGNEVDVALTHGALGVRRPHQRVFEAPRLGECMDAVRFEPRRKRSPCEAC